MLVVSRKVGRNCDRRPDHDYRGRDSRQPDPAWHRGPKEVVVQREELVQAAA